MQQRSVVLADSSFYIGEIRRGNDPLQQLRVLVDSHDVAVCGVVCCEVGRGMKNPVRRAEYHAAWALMLYIPTDNRLWLETEELLWTLGRRGKHIPLADALIACSALRRGAIVLCDDQHFKEVPGLHVAGSVREILGLR